ncbi:dipeptidyl aminopeptidase/acylaminoacyl peptidase [Hephaestia caeni]|uniref:Dipeptidyl aminopeptidase/acylaminoacyl peptidase n=1 Tax=Hephaestia caeni TaxID=645617 RepID=A0A397NN48_9SPHN|nr:S9 family peptidase [Hephaestia caeni]RIA37818.1 dipeptidyl aminopeptidase/acylaminoacyl peptidase [Hephaestia caeni]
MRLPLALLLVSVAGPAFAATHQYGDLVMSPDGRTLATIETTEASGAAVTLRDARDGRIIRTIDPCETCRYSDPTFGPDGTIAFLMRDGDVTRLEIAKGNQANTVATINGIAATPRFSPDGKRIALLVTIGAKKEAGATQAGVRQIGEIGEHYDERRLAIFDVGASVAADAVKPLSPADRYIYEYDWTPDGHGFVVTSAPGNGDANWWVATLDAVDATTGAVRNIARPTTQLNLPRVSPDGKSVAYIGGLMSDFGSIGGDVYTVPFTGGTPTNITRGSTTTNVSMDWLSSGIHTVALAADTLELNTLDASGTPTTTWRKMASFAAADGKVAYSADGKTIATVVQDFTHAPAIYAGSAAAPRQITHDNDDLAPVMEARSIRWKNEHYDVQGWLLSPVGADPKTKAPMITIVHGGPAAASTPRFASEGTTIDLLRKGYWLFLPNPRGSYGQGAAFVDANRRDFGGGDLRDILAGIDAVEQQAPIDDNRLGLMGGSYGGFMAMWANTQTDRFKAIVAGAGLSNWVSYYGTNGINTWMLPFFGKPLYDDYDAYRRVSAVNYVKNAKTPTFIYVGERDIEVPPTQSIEWWHALKDMGVPTTLMIYEGEGHGIRDPDHARDMHDRTIAWFDKYLAD